MKYGIAVAVAVLLGGPATAQITVSTIAADMEASGGVAIGADGNVYVADFGSSLSTAGGANVYRIAPDGSSVEILNSEFGGASGNAFGADGHLYQSDVGRGEAYRIAMDGTRTRIAQGMTTPVGIAPTADGTAYVTNCVPNRILHILADGTIELLAEGAPLNCPNGLAFGADGALYTLNFSDGGLVRIDPATGEVSVVAQIPGGGSGHLAWANERFYVASFRGGRIFSVTLGGAICLIAGSGARANADGDGLRASFFHPNGAAISADGNSFYTNTMSTITEPGDPALHPNAMRRVEGLLALLDCPAERRIETAANSEG